MKKLNSLITFKSALLTLLMMVLAIPAWAQRVYYNSSDKSLSVSGAGTVTKSMVQATTGYNQAESLYILSNVTGIAEGAFDGCVKVKLIDIKESATPLETEGNTFQNISQNASSLKLICNRNFTSGAFRGNTILTEVELGGQLPYLTEISNACFMECTNLAKVDLSKATNLKTIGNLAFEFCTKLTSINIPNTVTEIGEWAFLGTGLTSITIPNSVTKIRKLTFSRCQSLISVTIPNSVTEIEDEAFASCYKLPNITIPESVRTIGHSAFMYCDKLTKVTIPSSVTTININAFAHCSNLTEAVILGDPWMGTNAFPDGTKVIRAGISYENWLASYSDKTAVTELYIPGDNVANHASITTDNLALQFPNVKKVTFSPYVTAIGKYLFYNSATLETVVFEGDPVALGQASFKSCSKLATIGKVKSVAQASFENCTSLKSIEITNDDNIENTAFTKCSSLESVTLPSNLTEIAINAFGQCTALKEVSFPNSVETIKSFAFNTCTALEKVTFRKNVKEISNSAFNGCTALKKVTFMLSEDIVAANYTATSNLATRFPYAESFTLGSIENIGDYAFAGSSALKTISSATSIKSIGTGAFANCTNLSYVPYSYWISTLKTLGANAFENCKSLTEFYVSDQITELKANTFKDCTGLKIMTLGTRLATIDQSAAEGCTNLTELRILSTTLASTEGIWNAAENLHTIFPSVTTLTYGPNITEVSPWSFFVAEGQPSSLSKISFQGTAGVNIGNFAFSNNTELTTVQGNLKNIEYFAFFGCSNLLSIPLTSTEVIGDNAFGNCTSLTYITLPESLKTIGQTSFSGCTNLTDLKILGNALVGKDWEISTDYYNTFCTIFPYITNVTFGPNVTKVGKNAFAIVAEVLELAEKATIREITFQGTTAVGELAFHKNVNLTTINGGMKSVGEGAFFGCESLKSATITDSEEIGQSAFWGCSALEKVTLPANLTTIGVSAFWGCTNLTEIDIPEGVNTIYYGAFWDCTNLKKVICHNPVPVMFYGETYPFFNVPVKEAELLVPATSIAAYKAAPEWKEFYNISASDAITITDGAVYSNKEDIFTPVRYTRTFSDKTAGKWQCLYVPFDIPVTEELLKDFDFAKLYMVSYKDANNNGEIEDGEPLVLLISKVSAGKTLKGNTPYFIKAKTAGTKNIEVNGTMLYATASGSVDCSTTEHYYKLVGTNEPTLMRGKYGLAASGGFTYITSSTTKLGANRWYMEITSRTDGDPVYVSRPIEILVDGEDNTTGIMDIHADRSSRSAEGIFTLDGRKISDTENLPSGIYIKNGKKVVIK